MRAVAYSLTRRIGLALLACIPLLLGTEAFFALRYGYGNPRRMLASAELGYRLAPGQVSEGARGEREWINSRGYRDREWLPAGDAWPVIVVLGDTAAYGQGVPVEDTWPRVLEAELRRSHPSALVRRLGVPGYALDQMLAAYARDGREHEPDVVVFELQANSIRPMRVLHEPRRFPLQGLLQESACWDWIRRTWLVRPRDEDWETERRVLSDPYAQENSAVWEAAQARLGELQGELAARGAQLVLLAAPRLASALDTTLEDTRWRDWARARGALWVSSAAPLSRAMQPLRAELDRRGLRPEQVWNRDTDVVRSALEASGQGDFFVDDPVHIDAGAHRAVAGAVHAALAASLPVRGPEQAVDSGPR